MIKPWLFEFFASARLQELSDTPDQVNDLFHWYVDLWTEDEQRGFVGIFFSEHHFGPGNSPSPNLLIAHMAARTTTLRLGVLGGVSAYTTPWRVYEEFAMLDHLTQGRLEMGLVSGIGPEQAIVGISREESRERHEEILEVLQSAIKNPLIAHKGKYFKFEEVRFTPMLLQSEPALWTAATHPQSARLAGQRGIKLCMGFSGVEDLKEQVDQYREGAAENGHEAGPDDIAIRRMVAIVPKGGSRDEYVRGAWTAVDRQLTFPRTLDYEPPPGYQERRHPDEFVVGSPEEVAEELIRQCRALGAGNVLFNLQPLDRQLLGQWHDAIGEVVIPSLRDARLT